MGITYQPICTTNNQGNSKSGKKRETVTNEPVLTDTQILHEETVLDHNSPLDVSSDERLNHQDLESELREFLETGPMLRVCDSPTGS